MTPLPTYQPGAEPRFLQSEVGSRRIERCRVARGQHILFQDEGRDEAFAGVADFLRRMTN